MNTPGCSFEHACFISYKRPPEGAPEEHFYRKFVTAFQKRLEFYLTTPIRSFVDEDLSPGAHYPADLSQKLCKSVCFIVILTPEYLDSSWCQAEWRAMLDFEAKRLENRAGLVIPVVLRGEIQQWETRYERKPVDLRVHVPDQLKNIKHSSKIKRIADIVGDLVQTVGQQVPNCEGFKVSFDVEKDILAFSPPYVDPDPLGR